MARKKYTSTYKEKLYYDNTVFRGIMATSDPNAEGYFRQLINFDIADTGQSLTPRKGFLHTTMHDEEGRPVLLDPNLTVYYKDQDTGNYIFIQLDNYSELYTLYNTLQQYESSFKNSAMYDIYTRLLNNAHKYGQHINLTYFAFQEMYESYVEYGSASHSDDAQVTIWKPYYFSGCPDATEDILNDIRSYDGYGNNIVKNICDTINEINNNIMMCYRTNMSITQRIITATQISTIDSLSLSVDDTTLYYTPWFTSFSDVNNLEIIGSHYAQYVIDNNGVGRNIIKITYDTDKVEYAWIEFKYNATGDKLVVSVTNIDSTYSIDMSNRNLASNTDIIPNPIAHIYDSLASAHSNSITFSKFPMIYRSKEDIYLINFTDTLEDLLIEPSYYLLPPKEGYQWVYTYDIYSTSDTALQYKDNAVDVKYSHLLIHSLSDNTNVGLPLSITDFLPAYYADVPTGWTLYNNTTIAPTTTLSLSGINSLYHNFSNKVIPFRDLPTYIVWVVPKPTNGSTTVTSSLLDWGNGVKPSRLFLKLFGEFNGSDQGTYNKIGIGDTTSISEFMAADVGSILSSIYNIDELVDTISTNAYLKNAYYYIENVESIIDNYIIFDTEESYTDDMRTDVSKSDMMHLIETAFNSPLIITESAPLNATNFIKRIKELSENNRIIFKYMFTSKFVTLDDSIFEDIDDAFTTSNATTSYPFDEKKVLSMLQMIPSLATTKKNFETKSYYMYTSLTDVAGDTISKLFYNLNSDVYNTYYYPIITKPYYISETYTHQLLPTIFTMDANSDRITCKFNLLKDELAYLNNKKYFENGLNLELYIMQIPIINNDLMQSIITYNGDITVYTRDKLIASTTLMNNINIQLQEGADTDKSNQIERVLVEDPNNIRTANNWCVFNSLEGYRLIVWNNNIVYMSEPNDYGWFKQDNKKTYSENILKVLPYKDKLLVFTTQNMYAIFPYEYTTNVQNGTDEQGNPKYVQQTVIIYNTLPVLYNLYTDPKYLKVIQIYNSMVLYYSTSGQLYLIAPTTTVDSETMYTIKYMNQSANDILLNYDVYINKRLDYYKLGTIAKDDIYIDADVSISFIKIFYTIPTKNYTYILLYDIVNNRDIVYDTTCYGSIKDILYTDIESVIVSKDWNGYLSLVATYREPNTIDNSCDYTTSDSGSSFDKHEICTEIDTGILFLNNHLIKRYRTFNTIYKNIDANDLKYSLNVFVDDIRSIHTSMGPTIEVKDINTIFAPETIVSTAELLENDTVLFHFADYNSNKIITHSCGIPSLGKNIEFQIRFKSLGKYKLQGFGLIYKEHSV